MATYELICQACKATFILSDLVHDEVEKAWCVECQSSDLKLIGFNHAEDPAYYLLQKELEALKHNLDRRITYLEDLLGEVEDESYEEKDQN